MALGRAVAKATSPGLASSLSSPSTVSWLQLRQRPAISRQHFHNTPLLLKSGGKQNSKKNQEKFEGRAEAAEQQGVDANDLSAVESQFTDAHQRMKNELSKLRAGGQFNHELLEAVKVTLKDDVKTPARLGDLATVVPRAARQLVVLVGEQEHVKSVSSAILQSKHNLNPSANPHNPLELQISLPPPTAESRREVLDTADKAAQKALDQVNRVRGDHRKKLAALQKTGKARPDDVHKGLEKLDKITDAANKEMKDTLKRAKDALQR